MLEKNMENHFCSVNFIDCSVKCTHENIKITQNLVEQKVNSFFNSFDLTDETRDKGRQEQPKHFTHYNFCTYKKENKEY